MLRRLTQIAAGALTLGVVATGAAHAGTAAGKPGFLPGTWLGKGTISGSVSEYGMNTRFSGTLAFTLKIDAKLGVGGSGAWKMTMVGAQDAPSSLAVGTTTTGAAAVAFNGTATNVTFSGMQHIERVITMAGKSRTIAPLDKKLTSRLVIGRAGKCRVSGVTPIQPGVSLTWSAQLKGSGTCNA